jgi:hypothetical protein
MRIGTIILLLTILTRSHAHVPLGIGIVEIDFNDKTVIDFYKKPTDKMHYKRIEFFDDKKINSWNIRNLEIEKNWLKPEVLWLDYSQFNFRCKSKIPGWYEVIVNNEDGASLWIKESPSTEFRTWEQYLKNMFGVSRLTNEKQKIRKSANETSEEIKYEVRIVSRLGV